MEKHIHLMKDINALQAKKSTKSFYSYNSLYITNK